MRRLLLAMLLGAVAGPCLAAEAAVAAVPAAEVMKTLLNQATGSAVAALGRTDGFMGNPDVRIALPGKLQKASKKLRKLGLSKQTDALQLAMNRAAEAAVPEARELLLEAIREMTIGDAAALVSGPDDAATRYFESATSEQLGAKLLPLVDKAMAEVQLAKKYEDVAAKASALGLIDENDASLDAYITRKTLDGVFLMMAREEAAIRKNPAGQMDALLRKVFGATAPR